MDFFDMNKTFERTYVDEGKTAGVIQVQESGLVKPITKRKCQGHLNIQDVTNEDEFSSEDSSLSKHEPKNSINDIELSSVGIAVNTNELMKDKMSEIYSAFYENKGKPKSNLVIMNYKKKILSFVEMNEVTIITGPTGCGKTTQVPQFILDSHVEKNEYCNIIVTQPRRIAAISICKRVSEERGWPIGTLCGYKVGLKNMTAENTLLTYMTVGVFLQQLITKKNMNRYTHVILDEIHERDQSMDFALLVIKKLLNVASCNIKVILMSATVEASKFAKYFQRFYLGKFEYAPVIKIEHSTNYAVQIHYLEELKSLGNLPDIDLGRPSISEESYDICIKLIKQFEKIDTDTNKKNSVLVFLPGIYEIERLYENLLDPKIHSAGTVHYKWYPLPLHSSITIEEQAQVFANPPSGFRKIILSTNIAESSITVPGVKFVIDFCLTKNMRTHLESNFSCLELCWASQANCIQRAGRVGRVMEGRVYRMVYKDFFENLSKEPIPEMLTSPLEKVVLQSKVLDMGDPKSILSLAIDPPDLTNIEWTILILKETGGLLPTRKGVLTPLDGDLTFLGRLMALLPVDIYITRLIVFGHLFSCLEECIIIGASMSLKSVFSHPFQARLKAYNSKLDWADGSCSDCIAFLNVYEVWLNNRNNGYFKRSAGDGEKSWAKRHYIQLRSLKEVQILVQELTARLKDNMIEESLGLGKVQWNDFQKALVLKVAIAGAFYPNYYGRGVKGGLIDEREAVKMIGGRNPFTTVLLKNFSPDQPVELYSQLIKDELSECKEDMRISSDGSSKIFVEFRNQDLTFEREDMPFDGTLPGKIPMAVYRAVKIGEIKKTININVLPVAEAQKRAELLGINRKQTLLEEAKNEGQQTIPFNLPGVDISLIQLVISYIVDPGHFWACEIRSDRNQRKILTVLNGLKFQEKTKPFSNTPNVGDMCIAPFEEDGEVLLYRARIESVNEKGSKQMAKVFFIDYGNSSLVDVSDLRMYTPEMLQILSKIPAQAFECVLSNIRPSLIMNPRGKWSKKAHVVFQKIIHGEQLLGSIYSVVNDVVSLELFVMKPNKQQLSINEYLINEGLAERVEENYLSKENNAIRKQRQYDASEVSVCDIQQRQEYWLTNALEPPEKKDCRVQLSLRGPISPLEMKIYPYTRVSLGSRVHIASESVNSVLLDTDPQDPHERLIVAAHINVNPNNSIITLRNTTVMPNIHGLAALIAFIFAPEIELRVNRDRTRYIGMICGLGADEDGDSIFPEHDFEVNFDCEFTFEDFKMVNILRFYMGMLLKTEEDETCPNIGLPDIIKAQRNIKTNLLSLLSKQRKSVEVEFSQKEHVWKLCIPDLVANHLVTTNYNQTSIFRFHPGVTLRTDN